MVLLFMKRRQACSLGSSSVSNLNSNIHSHRWEFIRLLIHIAGFQGADIRKVREYPPPPLGTQDCAWGPGQYSLLGYIGKEPYRTLSSTLLLSYSFLVVKSI